MEIVWLCFAVERLNMKKGFYFWIFLLHHNISSILNNFLKILKLSWLISSTFVDFFSYTILLFFGLSSSFYLVDDLVEVNHCSGCRCGGCCNTTIEKASFFLCLLQSL